jgi:hypothetical protein
MHNTLCLIIVTKFRENQTSCNAAAVEVKPTIAIVLATTPKLSGVSYGDGNNKL